MARIAYDERDAAAFAANRHVDDNGLTGWREAVARHLQPYPGLRLLDLGAGTGWWASAFSRWYDGIDVIAVEPAAAMRARRVCARMVAGDAVHLPLADDSVDAVWLSTVIHHIPDLRAAADEVRRVIRPGGTVLIRSGFPGRSEGVTLFRFFPEAVRVVDSYPSVADIAEAFSGFTVTALEPVRQVTASSLREAAASLRREAHTPLQLMTDEDYAAGLARLQKAADVESGPVVDVLDLLVLKGWSTPT
jgi:SAM-dependent methyltransferase